MNTTNQFTSRMKDLLGRERLRSGLTIRAHPVCRLESLPPHTAKNVLQKHLETFYVPKKQAVAFAARILETGLAHALAAYPNLSTYVNKTNSDSIEVDPEPLTWIATGLAGQGKSALKQALKCLLAPAPIAQVGPYCKKRPILGGVFVQVSGRIQLMLIVNQLAEQLDLEPGSSARVSPELIASIKIELYRQGAMFILVDEQQGIAAGATAGASFVKFISFLRSFGVPVIVIGNYSMCHGLRKQHSQDRHRLLVDPFVMVPDAAEDPEYVEHLQQLVVACGGILEIDPVQDAATINFWTGGIARDLVQLVCIAYRLRRDSGRRGNAVVDVNALRQAYSDRAYSVFREEIEELRAHFLTGSRIRADLVCPFELHGESAEQQRRVLTELRRAAVRQKLLEDSLTPAEKDAIASGTIQPPQFLPKPDLATLTGLAVPQPHDPVKRPKSTSPSRSSNPGSSRKLRPAPSLADASRGWGA